MTALGGTVLQLPWLAPCATSLAALARSPDAATWEEVRSDPGAVLLIIRQTSAALATPSLSFFPSLLHDASICEGALRHLEQESRNKEGSSTTVGFVNWSQPKVQPVYRAALRYARLAYGLAEHTGRCDPDNAWIAGLLAPLGWLAVCAVDPAQASACLLDPALARNPPAIQQRHWGMDQAAIARRLARSWHLPCWLTTVVGYLGLPAETAQTLGAEPDLFRVVQLAVGLVQQHPVAGLPCLHLPIGARPEEVSAALGLHADQLASLEQGLHAHVNSDERRVWTSPHTMPLLADMLRLAAENRRLRETPLRQRLERDVDDLVRALEEHRAGETQRLQALKLNALAEFAAGAGHEINNPLAVISGQAQYLLGHEPEPARQQALRTIINQAQRIHHLLRDLMQFARPPKPQKQLFDLQSLVREVATSLGELAAQRTVRVQCPEPGQSVTLNADRGQVRTALTCLLRNAIEAAPTEGWATVRVETPTCHSAGDDHVEIVVEDSGPGPGLLQSDLLFDPFYSGRQAGRGRGLGLPTAWRLAREHGGDLRFAKVPGGPTRFILSLPHVLGEDPMSPNGQPKSDRNGLNGCHLVSAANP